MPPPKDVTDGERGVTRAAQRVSGLLLCKAGPHRLAFEAREVVSIAASEDLACPSARLAFRLPAGSGRALVGEDGSAVTVDSLEVSQDSGPLLGCSPLLGPRSLQSLVGFVMIKDVLWPLVQLGPFSRSLEQGAR